jgi:hypothetical protein
LSTFLYGERRNAPKKKKKTKEDKKKRMKIEPERCIYNQIGKRATQHKKTRQTAAAAAATLQQQTTEFAETVDV